MNPLSNAPAGSVRVNGTVIAGCMASVMTIATTPFVPNLNGVYARTLRVSGERAHLDRSREHPRCDRDPVPLGFRGRPARSSACPVGQKSAGRRRRGDLGVSPIESDHEENRVMAQLQSADMTSARPIPDTMRAVRYHEHGAPDVLRLGRGAGANARAQRGADAGHDRGRQRLGCPSAGRVPPLRFPVGHRPRCLSSPAVRPPAKSPPSGPRSQGERSAERVVLLSNPSCGRCPYCVKRGTHLCVARELPGHTAPGAYADYLVVAEDAILPTPADLSDHEAAPILWAYGTALHMLDVAQFRGGRLGRGDRGDQRDGDRRDSAGQERGREHRHRSDALIRQECRSAGGRRQRGLRSSRS